MCKGNIICIQTLFRKIIEPRRRSYGGYLYKISNNVISSRKYRYKKNKTF